MKLAVQAGHGLIRKEPSQKPQLVHHILVHRLLLYPVHFTRNLAPASYWCRSIRYTGQLRAAISLDSLSPVGLYVIIPTDTALPRGRQM